VIVERSGSPTSSDQWQWCCGFYSGSNPGDDRHGMAAQKRRIVSDPDLLICVIALDEMIFENGLCPLALLVPLGGSRFKIMKPVVINFGGASLFQGACT
jgi:hypothetical protein